MQDCTVTDTRLSAPTLQSLDVLMIDVSPLMLWPVDDVLKLMPIEAADNPQARRLAILVAEAQAAGQSAAVLAWLCDVARVLLLELPSTVGRSALIHAVGATEAIALRGEAPSPELRSLLGELCQLKAPRSPAEAAASTLAGWALGFLDRKELTAEQAWRTATELLAAVAQAAGDAASPTIARCAEMAYRRLF